MYGALEIDSTRQPATNQHVAHGARVQVYDQEQR
jgi:hypothetical protein